jgi:hypothetical protein
MFKTKSLAAILLVTAVLFAQVGTVFAAPPAQDTTPVPVTVTGLSTTTDSTGATIVVVTALDSNGATQTYNISVDTAVSLGLATVEPTTNQVTLLDLTQTTTPVTVTIDPATVLPGEEQPTERVNPISAFIAAFFKVDAATVQGYHDDGYGFGVIAQAFWMSKGIIEDGTTDPTVVAKCILDAKKNGTYGECFSFGDDPVPTNWGQFKKALMDNKEKHNLGFIVSGHADNGTEDVSTTNSLKDHGNGKDKNKNKGNNHGNPNKP